MENELKPCPFCGGKTIECYLYDREFGIERYKVCCFRCSAQFYRGTKKEAIEAWNRRCNDGT